MKTCRNCNTEKQDREFARTRTICYPCKYILAGGSKHDPEYMRDYLKKHSHDIKYKACLTRDRKMGVTHESIQKQPALDLMIGPCHYCQQEIAGGLDRLDNARGYDENNVVACCEKCNNILGDLPYSVKVLLASGLQQSKEQGLLDQWEIPTKRPHLEKQLSRRSQPSDTSHTKGLTQDD